MSENGLTKKELEYLAGVNVTAGEMYGEPLNKVKDALRRNIPVWKVDKGYGTLTPLPGYGEYTYLIGSYEEAVEQIKDFYSIKGLPVRWKLERITKI